MTQSVLDDYRSANIDERLRATLGFLEKMTASPGDLTTADADRVRAAGVSQRALEDAIAVCATFNVIDRIADTLQFNVPPAAVFKKMAKLLLRIGYE